MKKTKNIGIIGCGISGLSVAYILLKRDFNVTLISQHHPLHSGPDPKFASLYPAASIIPHSVFGENIPDLFKMSQSIFEELYEQEFPGLSIFQHYELFNDVKELPWYKDLMQNFVEFEDFKKHFYPSHPSIPVSSGWRFNCYFADWEIYLPALFQKVMEMGAELNLQHLNKKDLPLLSYDVIVNCGGFSGAQLFDDKAALLYRGHLLSLQDAPKLVSPTGELVSYNFSPGKQHYSTQNGIPQDVYCYSRQDGWVFGGSRQMGNIQNDVWQGDQAMSDKIEVGDVQIPAKILSLNERIIEHSFGIKARNYLKRKAKMGYRFIRKKDNGLRLEAEEKFGKKFIHNYGHGGAGVTLSWGCALKVAELLES